MILFKPGLVIKKLYNREKKKKLTGPSIPVICLRQYNTYYIYTNVHISFKLSLLRISPLTSCPGVTRTGSEGSSSVETAEEEKKKRRQWLYPFPALSKNEKKKVFCKYADQLLIRIQLKNFGCLWGNFHDAPLPLLSYTHIIQAKSQLYHFHFFFFFCML